MKLFVARHGETEWNAQNRVCGVTDLSLTEKGIAQAEALAQAAQGRDIQVILASPLKRAAQTAGIVGERLGLTVLTEPRLTEQNYGVYEGADRGDPGFLANKRLFAYRYPGGESMMQVAYRVYGLIDQVRQQYSGKNVLFVCHGGVCRVIHTYFHDMTNDEFFHYSQGNCGLEEYEL